MMESSNVVGGALDLQALAIRMHREYEVWYAKSVRRLGLFYMALQFMTMLAGFAAACLAALTSPSDYHGWIKAAMVSLPAIGSLAAGVIVQLRLQDLWRLREDGRIAFQDLSLRVEGLAQSAKTDAERHEAFDMVRCRIREIETGQSKRFFGLAPSAPVQYRPAAVRPGV
jgi:hypothetical protein